MFEAQTKQKTIQPKNIYYLRDLRFTILGRLDHKQDYYYEIIKKKKGKISKDGQDTNILVIPNYKKFVESKKFKNAQKNSLMIINENTLRDLLCLDDKIPKNTIIADLFTPFDHVEYSGKKKIQKRIVGLKKKEFTRELNNKVEAFKKIREESYTVEVKESIEKEWKGIKPLECFDDDDDIIYKFVDEEPIVLKEIYLFSQHYLFSNVKERKKPHCRTCGEPKKSHPRTCLKIK